MRLFACAVLTFLLSFPGIPQTSDVRPLFHENGQASRTGSDVGMFADSPTRMKIDLAGTWRWTRDGKEWSSVTVPSAYDFTGKVTFLRTFDIKPEMLDKYTFSLVVYGINYQSEITINGNFVGRHSGGYTSFVVQIPQNTLQVGSENAIKVLVDNELTPKTTLPLRQPVGGWKTYGGIFRDMYLLATPKLYVEETEVASTVTSDAKTDNKTAKIQLRSTIIDEGSGVAPESGSLLGYQVEAYDKLSGEIVGRSGISPLSPQANKSVQVRAEVVVPGAKVWSPETPDLYIFKCQIVRLVNKEVTVLDEYAFDYGFRDLQWKEGRLYVNGTATPLKGVLWQEDDALHGSALTYETLERDVATIKTLGANMIRFLYPPHPYMLNLCDRYGLFVMQEIPLEDVPASILGEDYYQDLAVTYAKEMVLRDRHHASVLAWGIGSEFETGVPSMCDFVNAMRNTVQSLDRRSVYYASRTPDDPCLEYVDLVAVNSYYADARSLREALKRWKTAAGAKPLILARYGQEVEPGNKNGYSDPLSLEAQARFVMQVYEAAKEAKIGGSVLWSFNDWRTDRPSLASHSGDPYLQSVGLVSQDREKRTSFDVARAMFNGEKVQALPVGNYSSSTPVMYVVAGLIVLISFAFFYNGNRRFRDSVNRSLVRTYNFFADVRDQRILTYGHSIFLAAVVSVTWATLLSSILSHYRDNLLLDNLLSHLFSDGLKEDLIYLIWNPSRFILVVSGIVFVKLVLISILVRVFSMLVRTHVYFYHAFSITIWSMLPYIIFIPIAMILYRLMEADVYTIPTFVLIGVVTVWVLIRLFKGISIIYDVFPFKVYVVGVLLIVLCAGALYGYVDFTRSTSVYLKYMMHSMKNPA
jgi:hypothetical protein